MEMAEQATRRSDRVEVTLQIEVTGTDINGQEFVEPARTVVVSKHGAAIALKRELAHGQDLRIRRRTSQQTEQEGEVSVVGRIHGQSEDYTYCVASHNPGLNLWGIEFPSSAEHDEALARMLFECGYCNTPGVVHLNELELAVFEAHQGIARHCKVCGAPTIWKQTPQQEALWARQRVADARPRLLDRVGERREGKRVRLKTRLSGCVRQPGQAEEMVVCENISCGGLCFRSRRRYAEGARIEIAVPCSKGSARVFVAARIVYAQEMPAVGLFRHGVTFRVTPQDSGG